MSDKIILRVFSKAGRSRVEIDSNQTLHDLKTELGNRLSITVKQIQLFKDEALKQTVAGRDTASIKSLFKNGDIIHVGNQNVELASVAPSATPVPTSGTSMIDTTGKGAAKDTADSAKPKPGQSGKTSRCHHISTQKCVHCMTSAVNAEEGKEGGDAVKEQPQGKCNHASTTRCPKCIGQIASVAPTKPKCHHGANQKCPNCLDQEAGMVADRKHDPFDGYIANRKKKCAGKHADNMRCQNCTFSQD